MNGYEMTVKVAKGIVTQIHSKNSSLALEHTWKPYTKTAFITKVHWEASKEASFIASPPNTQVSKQIQTCLFLLFPEVLVRPPICF